MTTTETPTPVTPEQLTEISLHVFDAIRRLLNTQDAQLTGKSCAVPDELANAIQTQQQLQENHNKFIAEMAIAWKVTLEEAKKFREQDDAAFPMKEKPLQTLPPPEDMSEFDRVFAANYKALMSNTLNRLAPLLILHLGTIFQAKGVEGMKQQVVTLCTEFNKKRLATQRDEDKKNAVWKCLGCAKETKDHSVPTDYHYICYCERRQFVCETCVKTNSLTEEQWSKKFEPGQHYIHLKGCVHAEEINKSLANVDN